MIVETDLKKILLSRVETNFNPYYDRNIIFHKRNPILMLIFVSLKPITK